MAAKTFATYLGELSEVTSLGSGDKVPALEGGAVKYVDGGDIGGAGYLVYVALLTQTGTDAPVATVLQNTLGGTVVWTRDGVGEYVGTLAGAFTQDKTICFGIVDGVQGDAFQIVAGRINGDSFGVDSYDNAWSHIESGPFSIEIRVYP